FRRSPGVGRPVSPDTLGDPLFQWFSTAVALGVVGLLVLITVILSLAAQDSIRTFGLGFLTGNVWNPVPPLVFGAVPFVYGTLVTSALALLFGVPISIGIAIFLSELSPPWLRIPLTYVVELLAAVPSAGRRRASRSCGTPARGSSGRSSSASDGRSARRWPSP